MREIYEYLDKKNKRDKILINILDTIKENVSQNIWARPLSLKYTDHGVTHSERVIKNFNDIIRNQMNTAKKLNSYELFIIYAAAYLHDIGMQITLQKNKESNSVYEYYELGKKDVSFLTPEDHEVIRKNHAEVSYKMIVDSVKSNKFKLGLSSNQISIDLAECIAKVCKEHSGNKPVKYNDENYRGENIRLTLLCYLLRIADDLDIDAQRVNLEELKRVNICTESKFHWWLHHYTDGVKIENENIRIFLKFPEHFDKNINELFWNRIYAKLSKSFVTPPDTDHLVDTFYENNIKLNLKKEAKINIDHAGSKQDIPLELEEFIQNQFYSQLIGQTGFKTNVQLEGLSKYTRRTKKWLQWFNFSGNPFTDMVHRFNPNEFVRTDTFSEMLTEAEEILSDDSGEIKLLVGERGSGKTYTLNALFEYFQENKVFKHPKGIEALDIIKIDASDIILELPSGRKLLLDIVKKINEKFPNYNGDEEDLPFLQHTVDNISSSRRRVLILIDNIDRLGINDIELRIVKEFFQTAQHIFQYLKKAGLVVISCRHNWNDFLLDNDLSYLNYRNAWKLPKFNVKQSKELIEKRLNTYGVKTKDLFSKEAIKLIQLEAQGIPRQLLQVCEHICKKAALKGKRFIDKDFVQETYCTEIEEKVSSEIIEVASSSRKCNTGLERIYNYYNYLEKHDLSMHTGFEIMQNVYKKPVLSDKISTPYLIGLKQTLVVRNISSQKKGNNIERIQLTREVKDFFQKFLDKGYDFNDFMIYYEKNPLRPISDLNLALDEFGRKITNDVSIDYYEKARKNLDELTTFQNQPKELVYHTSSCIEDIIKAILIETNFYTSPDRRYLASLSAQQVKDDMHKFLDISKLTFNYLPDMDFIISKKICVMQGKVQASRMKKNEIESVIEQTKSTVQSMVELYNRNF